MYLPRPYPDELIGSVIARDLVYTGLSTKKYLYHLLGRKVGSISLFLPSNIKAIADAMVLEVNTVLWSHTVFPFVTAFMSLSEIKRLKDKTLQLSSSSEESLSSLVKSVTQGSKHLKYCPKCCAEELDKYGESYWHRQHNLPTAVICRHHRTARLVVCTPSMAGAFGIGQPHHHHVEASPPQLQLSIASDLAIRVERLFYQSPEEVDWIYFYRTTAYKVGYGLLSGDIAGRQLSEDLHNHFGARFLLECGCHFNIGARSPWPALMLRPANNVVFSPTKHLLLQSFLASVPKGDKPLSYTRPGRHTRNYHQLDVTLAMEMQKVMLQAQVQHVRLTVKQLTAGTGLWTTFRHQRNLFPLSCRMLDEFRRSEVAERQVGRRPYWRKRLGMDHVHDVVDE